MQPKAVGVAVGTYELALLLDSISECLLTDAEPRLMKLRLPFAAGVVVIVARARRSNEERRHG